MVTEVWVCNEVPEIDVDSILWDDSLANDIIDDTDWTVSDEDIEILSEFVLLLKLIISFVNSKLKMFSDSDKSLVFKDRVLLKVYSTFKLVLVSRTIIIVEVEIESDNELEREAIVKFCESNKIPDNVVDSIFWDDSPANDNIDDTEWSFSSVEVEILSELVL